MGEHKHKHEVPRQRQQYERFAMLYNPVLSWQSQVTQYPMFGEPGISYYAGEVGEDVPPVDCLLYRNPSGLLIGILNHYSVDYPPWEQAGNVNIWVHPDCQRRGIGTALLTECKKRWGFNEYQQCYTPAGIQLMMHFTGRNNVSDVALIRTDFKEQG